MRPLILLFTLSACAKSPAPVAPAQEPAGPALPPTEPVVTLDGEGNPLLRSRPFSFEETGCTTVYEQATPDGWGPPVTLQGALGGLASNEGTLAGWLSCHGGHLELAFITDNLSELGQGLGQLSDLPEFLSAVWFDGGGVHFLGTDGGDPVPTHVRYLKARGQWERRPSDCIPLTPTEEGLVRDDQTITGVQATDLNDDDLNEWIIEEPDTCGTAACTLTVYTRCLEEGTFRPVGSLTSWTGLTQGPGFHDGWMDLITTVGQESAIASWNGHSYHQQPLQ